VNRVILSFSGPATSPTNLLTAELSGAELIILKPGLSLFFRTFGASEWAAMSLPTDDFVAYGVSLAGRDLMPSDLVSIKRPPPSSLSRLNRLHEATISLAKTAPDVAGHPDAVRAREQTLVQAAFACMAQGTHYESVPGHQRARVLARFEAILEASPDTTLFIPEICEAIGVSGRTLRICCAEALGMSPLQYLHLRRMHLVRRALLQADPKSTTVTEIATRFGFWELGRFAGRCHSVFNEFPNVTLSRQFADRLPTQKLPFGPAIANCA
jgi:AraC-like DNA-binding protein